MSSSDSDEDISYTEYLIDKLKNNKSISKHDLEYNLMLI